MIKFRGYENIDRKYITNNAKNKFRDEMNA